MINPLRARKMRVLCWVFMITLGSACSLTGHAQVRQVNGQMILGQSGTMSGALTLMPPDGTGWYHIDNPGNQQIRISGGGQPGQYVYLTIGHPGRVTVHGDLVVSGALYAKWPGGAPAAEGGTRAKSDAATPGDVEMLQARIDELNARIRALDARIDALQRQRTP